MSQKNDISQDNEKIEVESLNEEKTAKLVVKKKRFKKSDILVFGICLVASVAVWMYASNLQKSAQENELNKEAVKEIVESGMSKNTEAVDKNAQETGLGKESIAEVVESIMNSTETLAASEAEASIQ